MARSEYRDLDTDVTLGGSGASDIYVPSQKAVKTYIDNATNLCYSAQNPQLTPTLGYATWTVTHNLGTTNVICTVYSGGLEIARDVTITSADVITLSIPASTTISANALTVVVVGIGGTGTGADSAFSFSSPNPLKNSTLTNHLMYKAGDTITLSSYGSQVISGYVTNSRKDVCFSFTTPKELSYSLHMTPVSIKGNIRISTGGYLFSSQGYVEGGYEILTGISSCVLWLGAPNVVTVDITYPNAFTNVTNNTPLSIVLNSVEITLT